MINQIYFSAILMIWQMWWFSPFVALVVGGIVFLLTRRKLNTALNTNGILQQRVVEYKELLNYAKENEQKAIEEAEAAANFKSVLLAKLSHEIRTPMNGVIGMASLLSETELTAEQREYAEVIIESSESLMTTINDMLVTDVLQYAATEEKRMELEDKDFDLRNTIETVLDSFAEKAVRTNLELIYSMDKDVPEMVVGDELRLRQILMNLIENSLRFTTQGEILIAAHLARMLDGNQAEISFEVRDTGIGMPDDEMELLSKDINEISTKNDSNVLSLAICKKLIALMGGKLELETNQGNRSGTIIKFKICIRVSLQPQRPLNKFGEDLRRKNILLVDDNFTSRNILKKQLEQWNLLPIVTSSAKEALEVINKNSRFDLVITDLEMPQMNGIELSEAIKKINPNISILLLNLNGDERYKQHTNLFKATLTKPVKQHLLYKYISHELSKKETTEQQSEKPKLTTYFANNYPLRILVAEDNETNQKVALKALNKLGYEVTIAQNGEEALELVSDGKYDLIFMDVQMPLKDGLETTRMIRLCLNTQPVIIAMTANAIQGDKQKCISAGMDDYISKPFKMEELTKMIEKWAIQLKVK